MSYARLDKTFINALKARLGKTATIVISNPTDSYIITAKNGKKVELNIIACLRRSHWDHEDMIQYVIWKISLSLVIFVLIMPI